MTYTTLLQWSIQRHVHDPTQRHARGLINVVDVSYTTSCPWPSLPGIHAQYNGVPVTCITSIYHHLLVGLPPVAGVDPGFQVRGGGGRNSKYCAERSEARNVFGVIRVKNHDFTPKNLIFSNFRGGGGRNDSLVVITRYSGFLHPYNWLPQYS